MGHFNLAHLFEIYSLGFFLSFLFSPETWDRITNLPASNEISIWSGTRLKVHCTPLFARSPNPPSLISFHKRFQCRAAIQSWGKSWPDHDKTWRRKVKHPSFQTKHLLGPGTNINLCSLFCSWCVIWLANLQSGGLSCHCDSTKSRRIKPWPSTQCISCSEYC